MYDDRLKIYSPEGMMDRRLIQQQNPLTVPSKRRNPLLADFFSRLGLMKRRGSEMKKIINAYKSYEHLAGYRAPEFTTNASEFHVTLWNLNFKDKVTGEITPSGSPLRARKRQWRGRRKRAIQVRKRVHKNKSPDLQTDFPKSANQGRTDGREHRVVHTPDSEVSETAARTWQDNSYQKT